MNSPNAFFVCVDRNFGLQLSFSLLPRRLLALPEGTADCFVCRFAHARRLTSICHVHTSCSVLLKLNMCGFSGLSADPARQAPLIMRRRGSDCLSLQHIRSLTVT